MKSKPLKSTTYGAFSWTSRSTNLVSIPAAGCGRQAAHMPVSTQVQVMRVTVYN